MPANIPSTIGPFRVESLLGAGGMGEVYKAVDPTLGRTVAVKIVRADSSESQYFKRLLREAQAYGRLKHPNIVTVYEAREAEGGLYIAMEYLEGDSLTTMLNRDELSLEARIEILIQILDALKYAHAQGIIHRDIKPSNIHVLADGTVKLLDFGLARVVRTETLTATDVVLGTPHYASPEQLMGQEVDGRTDVYSAGVVAFQMLTRRRPFDGNSLGTIVAKVLSEPTPPMDTPWSRAFPEIEQIVRRAMAKQVADRFGTAGDMQQALKDFQKTSQAAIRRASDATTRVPLSPVLEGPTVLQTPEPRTERVEQPPAVRGAIKQQSAPPSPQPVAANEATENLPPTPAAPPPRPSRSSQPVAPMPQPALATPTPKKRPWVMWLGAFGALAGIVFLFVMVGQRRGEDRSRSEPAGAAGRGEAGGSDGSSAAGGGSGASSGSNASGRSIGGGEPDRSGVPRKSGERSERGQPSGSNQTGTADRSGGPVAVGRGRAQVAVEPRTVFIEAGGDARFTTALTNALAARAVRVIATAGRARLAINARIEISIRPSPVGGTSALTADFVATLQMRDATSGVRSTKSVDGHALDFGEPVVRQAAYNRAAEQLAEVIDAAMRD